MKFHISYFIFHIFSIVAILELFIIVLLFKPQIISASTNYWEIQSIDTMKYSRDLARERNGDKVFKRIIETYAEKIASTGATHIAVGTPYDSEFIPFLEEWILAARNVKLKVWFRGNFSGWEGWFDYPKISKEEHLNYIENFIVNNAQLFEDGDIFTPCTECENGSLGDPRLTGNLNEYREFLIDEYRRTSGAFEKIDKKVKTGYFSMNADVALLIMDEETTKRLGGVVVIDHYVKDPSKLSEDIKVISENSKGRVILGEFGVPIPDIHGNLNNEEQAAWLSEAFNSISKNESLIGLNYWVSFGGSTAIWNNDGSEKPAVSVIRSYFSANTLSGLIINEIGQPIENALVIADSKQAFSDKKGEFNIASNPSLSRIIVIAKNYKDEVINLNDKKNLERIIMKKEKENIIFRIRKYFYETYRRIIK